MCFTSLLQLLDIMNQDRASAKQQLAETMERIQGAYAPATIRAYREDFEKFIEHAESAGDVALPASPLRVTQFIRTLSEGTLSPAYIRRIVAAISTIHRLNRCADPTKDPDVALAMRRMYRELGRYSKQAAGITASTLELMLEQTGGDPRGKRNRGMLLLAYEGLLRRSELVALRAEDLVLEDGNNTGRILLRRSKTDQVARGRWIGFTGRTAEALSDWLACSKITAGFLFQGVNNAGKFSGFLCAEQVNRIYKRLAKAAGIPVSEACAISGHSLRVGAARDLLTSGADLVKIMSAGRWSKPDTVMRYVEQVQGAFIR